MCFIVFPFYQVSHSLALLEHHRANKVVSCAIHFNYFFMNCKNKILHSSKRTEVIECTLVLYIFYQLPLILTPLLHVDLINAVYLTVCAFNRSS